MEHTGTEPIEPDTLKLVFGGLKPTKQYVISEIERWGSPNMNPEKMWDDAVRAGRIKKVKTEFGFTFYALDCSAKRAA